MKIKLAQIKLACATTAFQLVIQLAHAAGNTHMTMFRCTANDPNAPKYAAAWVVVYYSEAEIEADATLLSQVRATCASGTAMRWPASQAAVALDPSACRSALVVAPERPICGGARTYFCGLRHSAWPWRHRGTLLLGRSHWQGLRMGWGCCASTWSNMCGGCDHQSLVRGCVPLAR